MIKQLKVTVKKIYNMREHILTILSCSNICLVWNIRTNSPWSVMTLVGHSGTVRCLHLLGNRLVSGSTDMTLKGILFLT